MTNLQPGQMLGPYRILNQIGQGGMATVYKAYQPSMDRNVAIKVLPSQLAESREFTKRFQQEARIIAHLEHAHILPIFDYGESDGIAYFVMRYLEAGTLKDKMAAGPMSLNEINRIITQVADALGYAHSRGVIHRDLKPANVLVDSQGDLFLTDFGIAKILEDASPRLTQTDAIMGTPAYISPEQARADKVDQRTDIYSLGIILYEMVTGRVPFIADTPLAVILKHVSDPLPLPSSIKSDIPEAIEQVLLKALAKDPQDRFATTAELLAAWKRALQEKETERVQLSRISIPASPAGTAAAAPKAVSQSGNRAGWIVSCLVVACVLFSIAGAGVFIFNWSRPTPTATFPSPTKTPLSLDTPALTGNVLLKDDFSDNSVWGTISDSDNIIKYDGNSLRMLLYKKSWLVWSTPNSKVYENIHLEITATNNDGESTTAFGIICHQQETTSSYYYLAMAPDGEYIIGKAAEGKPNVAFTSNKTWATSNLIKRNASSYRLGADCGNGQLTLYVDSKPIYSVFDSTYTKGSAGLLAWSGANADSADVTFDDFLITSLK